MRVAAAAVAALLVGAAACGNGEPTSDEASFGASSVNDSSSTSTTAPPVGTPFPDGVYQWSLTAEDWTAAGLPGDTESDVQHHVVTFAGGTAYDIAVHEDGTREPASTWHYASTGEQEITLTDEEGRSLRLHWELGENELTFTMDPNEGEPYDRALWTARPLAKVG
ncbi:MAG TPA: hypothetical protein VIL48_16450 [Acidimicrobiales bacterium]